MGKILIAGGAAPFAGWLAGHLQAQGHSVRVTATAAPAVALPAGVEFVLCGLEHTDEYSLGEAVWFGCEQIVLLTNCTAFGSPDEQSPNWLEQSTGRRHCHPHTHTHSVTHTHTRHTHGTPTHTQPNEAERMPSAK